MSSLKPITLHSHASGPNPWKVAIILEELNLPYKTVFQGFDTLKAEPFININPNGRVPAIEDPNTGINLWESGAIIQYLVENYDKEGKISYQKAPQKYYEQQWLAFQISGQGPYYGQSAWFHHFHSEQVQSAKERYVKEIERVIGVLDSQLQKHEWLVGDKCTYADLSFVTWANLVPGITGGQGPEKGKYKAYDAWLEKLNSRPSVVKTSEDKKQATSKGH